MAKTDAPLIMCKIAPGPHLVPISAFDAERLESWSINRVVGVQIAEDGNRPGVKKWWAIINRAVKDSPTPWKNPTQASEAIKLAIGVSHVFKSANGDYIAAPRSLVELTDAEIEDAVIEMKDLLFRITGVDPDAWRSETADTGPDHSQMSSAQAPDPAEEAGSDTRTPGPPATQGVAPDQSQTPSPTSSQANGAGLDADLLPGVEPDRSAAADLPEGDDGFGSAEPPLSPSGENLIELKRDCVFRLIRLASDTKALPDAKDRQEALIMAKDSMKVMLPVDEHGFLKTCVTIANDVITGKKQVEAAREYLGGLVR